MADDEPASPGSPSKDDGSTDNVKVMVRVRLFNKREQEISQKKKELLRPCVRMRPDTCVILEHGVDDKGFPIEKEREAFQFNECFWSMPMEQAASAMEYATQKMVYESSGLLALNAAFQGYNVCIFAYGQTGSGKTYSMLGSDTDPGISPRLVDDLFAKIAEMETTAIHIKSSVECMFFEIYNEKVRDLFKKTRVGEYDAPKIRQHPTKGVFVDGLNRKEITEASVAKRLIEKGTNERAAAETKMNAHSSRSHAIFQIQVIQNDGMKGTSRVASINLVDLAGSEKIKMSGATGETLTEAKNINQSLSTLRKVIDVLIENSTIKNKRRHRVPPFRESVLTWVLSDSLGGNSKTQMIATISPHESNIEDTLGTLRYALRAKAIVCNAKVNEEKSAAMVDSMRDEIMLLQQKLREGKGGAISSDIKKEIELREKEISNMTAKQEELHEKLEEAKAKEVEMEQKMKEVDAAKQELSLAVNIQKRERFAAAFRNAFLITAEKKKIETGKIELDALTRENTTLKDVNANLEAELKSSQTGMEELQRSSEEQIATFQKDIGQRDTLIVQLKRQVANQTEENAYLRTTNDTLTGKVNTMDATRLDLERRIQRMQEELIATNTALDREKLDKKKQEEHYEKQLAQSRLDNDNLRKRKDKYKEQAMEATARSDARNTVIEALQQDRASFLTTIKAQQNVVSEHSAAVNRMINERKETEQKAGSLEKKLEDKEDDLKCMKEALREYEAATAEWMYENHAMTREVERVSKSYNDLRGTVDPALSQSSPYGSAYGGSPHSPPGYMANTGGSLHSASPRSATAGSRQISSSPIRSGGSPNRRWSTPTGRR